MIDFIICEDNENVRDIYKLLISKIVMPYDFNYKVYLFEKYNNKMKELIVNNFNFRIYLLDLELPGKNGIEIAKEIRKNDWDSIIIVLTSHDELELKILKKKLLIFDFISKFEDYEERLYDSINTILKKYSSKKTISFKSNKELINLKLEDILYIYKTNDQNKIEIITKNNKYSIRNSLSNLSLKLDTRFYKTHRACIVNIDKIKKVDFKNEIIYFENNTKIVYLSRNYKKGLKDRL